MILVVIIILTVIVVITIIRGRMCEMVLTKLTHCLTSKEAWCSSQTGPTSFSTAVPLNVLQCINDFNRVLGYIIPYL